MKVLDIGLRLLGATTLLALVLAAAAGATGKFSFYADISGGRYGSYLDLKMWRCVAEKTEDSSSVCRGYTLNTTGIARTESHGGSPHN